MHCCGPVLTAVSVAPGADPQCCCQDTHKLPCACCHDHKVASAAKDVKPTAADFKPPVPEMVFAPPVLRLVWQLAQLPIPAGVPAARLVAHAAP